MRSQDKNADERMGVDRVDVDKLIPKFYLTPSLLSINLRIQTCFGAFLIFWYNDTIMNTQVGGFVDEKLYSRGGGGDEADDGQSMSTPQETDPYSLGRKLNAQRAEASRAAQLKSAATSVAKKLAKNEVKTMVATGFWAVISTVGSAIISAIGIVLVAAGPYILAFLMVMLIITMIPGLSTTLEFVGQIRSTIAGSAQNTQ